MVGDNIRDEFETETTRDFLAVGEGQYIASGSLTLFDLEEELPNVGEVDSESVSTLGGYITDRLGHLPRCEEQVRLKDYLITVTGTDGRRVTQARIVYDPVEKPEPEEELAI